MNNIIRLIRPQQWIKNVFVLMPMFFGGSLLDPGDILASALAFLAFSFTSSSVYCLNDINDIEADRRHPVKCRRPLASGALPVSAAWGLMALMLALRISVMTEVPPSCWQLATLRFLESFHPLNMVIKACN